MTKIYDEGMRFSAGIYRENRHDVRYPSTGHIDIIWCAKCDRSRTITVTRLIHFIPVLNDFLKEECRG